MEGRRRRIGAEKEANEEKLESSLYSELWAQFLPRNTTGVHG